MDAFLTELSLTPLPDGRNWRVDNDFVYLNDLASEGCKLTIPAGFVTDLASVPRVFWDIYPPFGKYTEAAVIHDYGYRHGGVYPGCKFIYTKAQVDLFFYDAMRLCGVGFVTRNILYQAVSKFGSKAFKVD